MKGTVRIVLVATFLFGSAWFTSKLIAQTQAPERVTAIRAPATSILDEAASRGVTKFSFLVYGDTRGRRDGTAIQYEHSLIVDSMLGQIKKLVSTEYPVKFVLQSGDAVQDGRDVKQWNNSFVPLIDRLTIEGGVPYFLVPGNHERTTTDIGMKNYLEAVSALIPPEGSARRLKGYGTYSFAYGNTFVLALDANVAADREAIRMDKKPIGRARPKALRQCYCLLSSGSIFLWSSWRTQCRAAHSCLAESLHAAI